MVVSLNMAGVVREAELTLRPHTRISPWMPSASA